MNKNRLVVIVFFAVVVMVASVAGPSGKRHPRIDSFAMRVAGTYLMQFGLPDMDPFGALMTINADGTVSGEDTTDYGVLELPAFQSPQRGAWKRSGKYELTSMSLGFDYDDDGRFSGILRIRNKLTFDKSFNNYKAVGLVEVFLDPLADPLDPNVNPDISYGWEGYARRVPATME